MKQISLGLLLIALTVGAYAQQDQIKPSSFSIGFGMYDFKTATEIRNTSLATVLRNDKVTNLGDMNPSLFVSYTKGITNHVDFDLSLAGSFLRYPIRNKPAFSSDHLLTDINALVNIKLLPDNFFLVPYLIGGIGATSYQGYFAAQAPVGVGLQFRLAENNFIRLASQYRIPVTESANYHFFHGLSVLQSFPKKKIVPVVEPPVVILDRDGDGVLDVDDKCPDVFGLSTLMGCPDRDGDGIADGDDKCPDQAGLAKYEGCPIPDTDGDGINDENDKCPTVFGIAKYQGCPIPDTDGDGVNDEEDKCPSRPGPVSNQGCPEIAKEVVEKINFAAKNVFFATGSFKLLPKSFASLKGVADLMKADPTLMLDVDGHTDAQGADDMNQTLSENRAASVKDYLISQGVEASRMNSKGYGEGTPVADNTTAAGRAKNRRTEMTVRNF